MTGIKLTPIQYELEFDEESMTEITLDRVRGIGCFRWAIRNMEMALGKTLKGGCYHFSPEILPSSREDEYYREFRWETKEEALEFWIENRPRILATPRERYAFWSSNA